MTDADFEQATEIVWNNMLTLLKPFEQPPTDEQFSKTAAKVRQVLNVLMPDISDGDYKKILRTVRANVTVRMEGNEAFITGDAHKKWLDTVKSSVDWFFWSRYEKYLRTDKKFSPALTAALNTTSDKILELTGEPNSAENFSRRGLIIGEVQSGKTANYTALCAKAADVGYKVIIVLTGMLEDLRRQTQAAVGFGTCGAREPNFFVQSKRRD